MRGDLDMEEKIKKLKEKLQKFGTRELLGMIGIHFLTFGSNAEEITEQSDIFNKTEFMSPLKQYAYLAGLLMSTNDLSNGVINEDLECYDELEKSVQEITLEYSQTFLDFGDASTSPDLEAVKRNLVSMEAFTSYFDTGILRYDHQTENLMRTLYSPFDEELEKLTSLRIADFISFYDLICDVFATALDTPKIEMTKMTDFLASLNPNSDDVKADYQKLLSFAQGQPSQDLQTTMDSLNTIKTTKIIETFEETKGKALINIFSLKRKERDFLYYNSNNPFVNQPLCWIDEGETFFIVHPQFVLTAIYNFVTATLENPKNLFAQKYNKNKADIVENIFLAQLKQIFGEDAKYHVSVCEERGTKEHDILVEFENYIIVAEVKASKVREPFFNPEKAFTRIKDHFNSDTGIGGAYQQAIILKKFIEQHDSITLYENKIEAFTINEISTKKILPFVLTLNQFGNIAVNTSLLLEKENDQLYPWICNLHDFENIIEINKYLNKSPHDFIDYVVWRIERHKDIISSDELDVIEGYYFDKGIKNATNQSIFFWPTGPSLIDKIYYEKQGIPYSYPPLDNVPRKHKKIGRNDPCSCGSGKKYKKCCGI